MATIVRFDSIWYGYISKVGWDRCALRLTRTRHTYFLLVALLSFVSFCEYVCLLCPLLCFCVFVQDKRASAGARRGRESRASFAFSPLLSIQFCSSYILFFSSLP